LGTALCLGSIRLTILSRSCYLLRLSRFKLIPLVSISSLIVSLIVIVSVELLHILFLLWRPLDVVLDHLLGPLAANLCNIVV